MDSLKVFGLTIAIMITIPLVIIVGRWFFGGMADLGIVLGMAQRLPAPFGKRQ